MSSVGRRWLKLTMVLRRLKKHMDNNQKLELLQIRGGNMTLCLFKNV